MPHSSSHTTSCAACKFLHRRCTADCVFSPYFPADQQNDRFLMVHRVFGTSNAAKILHQVHVSLRHDAAETLVFQAEARLRDPVYGSVSLIARLNETHNQIQHEISSIMSEISYYQNLLSSPNPMGYDQEQQPTRMLEAQMIQQQQPQQHEMMMGYDDQHEQQQMMMMMAGEQQQPLEVLEVAQLEPQQQPPPASP